MIRTFISHKGPIHDIQSIGSNHAIGLNEPSADGNSLGTADLCKEKGLTRFVTCASDRTIRFWHFLDNRTIKQQNRANIQKGLFRNAYCKDMSKIIFVKNIDEIKPYNFDVFRAKPLERTEDGQ